MRPHKPLSSSVGSKFLIAFTGLSLLLFLVAHLGGNLLFLLGPDAFNQYSHKLISNPLIYVAEGGLLAVFLVHVLKTTSRFAFNLAARPDRDAVRAWARTKNPKSRKTLTSLARKVDAKEQSKVKGGGKITWTYKPQDGKGG